MIAALALMIGVVGVGIAATVRPRVPAGATPLALRTYPTPFSFPWEARSCGLGLLPAVKMVLDDGTLVFDLVETGGRAPVVFPSGFQAWIVTGTAVLVSPEGHVLAREGDVLDGLGGSAAGNGDLHVCFTDPGEYDEVVRGA